MNGRERLIYFFVWVSRIGICFMVLGLSLYIQSKYIITETPIITTTIEESSILTIQSEDPLTASAVICNGNECIIKYEVDK